MKKIKILSLSDLPFSPSGVGIQTRYVLESAVKSGLFQVRSLGGAIKHDDYNPMGTEEYKEDWIVQPVDGYGNQNIIRSEINNYQPDILWFMTDPRFYGWLWEIENEIRANVPMMYYHVWDNYPYPKFNKKYYDSNDVVVTISKVTNDIVANVSPEVDLRHIPHSIDTRVFKKYGDKEVEQFKNNSLKEKDHNRMVFFWNNRNARRKQSGSLIYWFKDFLDDVGHDKSMLI